MEMREKLAKLEALIARDATAGERAATGAARDRLRAKRAPAAVAAYASEVELQYSQPDVWSFRIFVALYRKHGIRPYRYLRQQTVAAEFRTLHEAQTKYFKATIERLIADAMKSGGCAETLEQRRLPG